MRALKFIPLLVVLALTAAGCASHQGHSRAVYMLLDTSGTYTKELDKANGIINYLLATLTSGDSLAVARIDSGSFSEKDIIAKVTFDGRPSVANQQKRAFRTQVDEFLKNVNASGYTDISGGMLQASQYLTETGAGNDYILLFTDLKQDLKKGEKRDFQLPLQGIHVVALNVTKLRSDNVDPQEYLDRVDKWHKVVTQAGGSWRLMND
ncbi:MAG: VWA domain-containing protein, partial [Gammaproteobacteria bacterium]